MRRGASIAVVAIVGVMVAGLAGAGPGSKKSSAKKPPAKTSQSEMRLRVGPDELLTVSLYLNRLRDNQPYLAIDEFFDVDGFMSRVFGEDLKTLMSDERAYARQMAWVFIKGTITLVPHDEWKQPISINNLRVARVEADTAQVQLRRPGASGDVPFELRCGIKGWRIVDLPPLAESLRAEYLRLNDGRKTTPLEHLEILVSRTLEQKRTLKERTQAAGQP